MRQVGMRWWVRGLSSTGAARFGCSPLTLLRNFSGKVAAAPFTAAAVQSPSPPWLMLPPGSVGDSYGDNDSQHDHEHYHLFSVAEKKVLKIKKNFGIPWRRQHFCPEGFALCLGSSSYGWQTFVNQRTCKLFLFNPLGNPLNFSHTFIPLPPVESFRNCISSFHRQNIISTTATTEVKDVDSEYNFIGNGSPSPLSPEWVSKHVIHKLVLSSPPLTGEDGSLAYNEDCLLMARLGFGLRFVCCRPGDTAWTSLNDGGRPYSEDDFIYFSNDQLFYSLTCFGNLESWDIRSPNSMNMRCQVYNSLPPTLQPTMNEHQIQLRVGSHNSYHLVESYGDLLLVVRYSRDSDSDSDVDCDGEKTKKKESTVAFDVYKFDFGRKKWVYVPNLGDDRVLFLGLNSFSVSLSDDRGLQGLISGNLIYFSFGKDQYHDSGIYHLDDGSITTFLPKCSSSQKNQFSSYPPIWIHPQL